MLPGGLLHLADLDDRLATLKHGDRFAKDSRENRLEPCIGHVPACKPDHLWLRAMSLKKSDEILVLRKDGRTRLAGLGEDFPVLGFSQTEIPNVNRLHAELPANPQTEFRRNLSVQPQNNAATTG